LQGDLQTDSPTEESLGYYQRQMVKLNITFQMSLCEKTNSNLTILRKKDLMPRTTLIMPCDLTNSC